MHAEFLRGIVFEINYSKEKHTTTEFWRENLFGSRDDRVEGERKY
jgi:hypothetical protein